ncbi:MAG: hypothetical protein ACHP7D_12365 [Lysobacterales bacterium]
MKSAPTIAFDYRPSRQAGVAATLIVVAAALAPWFCGLSPALRALLSLLALVVGAQALYRHWYPRFGRIAYRTSGWLLADAANGESPALLESHAHLGALLSLGFRYGPRARFRVLLTSDNLDADTRRRLVLLLARAEIAHAK